MTTTHTSTPTTLQPKWALRKHRCACCNRKPPRFGAMGFWDYEQGKPPRPYLLCEPCAAKIIKNLDRWLKVIERNLSK